MTDEPVRRFTVVPASYLIFLRDDSGQGSKGPGEVLLQYRAGTGYRDDHWAMAAAGHVEADESAFAAVIREAAEELGVTVAERDLVPVCTLHRTGQDPQDVTGTYEDERCDFFFLTTRWSGEPVIMEPDKASDLRWFALDRLPDPVVPHELTVLEALRDQRQGLRAVPPIIGHGW